MDEQVTNRPLMLLLIFLLQEDSWMRGKPYPEKDPL
jgi:hypothetical protein